jgi:hypothetical protein
LAKVGFASVSKPSTASPRQFPAGPGSGGRRVDQDHVGHGDAGIKRQLDGRIG